MTGKSDTQQDDRVVRMEVYDVRSLLYTPWPFHNWLRKKMPWKTAVGFEEYPEILLRRFLKDSGVENFTVVLNRIIPLEKGAPSFRLQPWALKFILMSSRQTGTRISVFRALRVLYKVEHQQDLERRKAASNSAHQGKKEEREITWLSR